MIRHWLGSLITFPRRRLRRLLEFEILEDRTTPSAMVPTVSITTPTNNASYTGTVTVAASASDSLGIAGVQFLLDGADLGTEVKSAPYSISWNTTTASPGPHTLTAQAIDTAGNTAASAPVAVTVVPDNNTQALANSYDSAWQAAWIAHTESVYTTVGKTPGFVLEIGDSITYANPYAQWPVGGAGATASDKATIAWSHAGSYDYGSNTDTSNKNGFYLATADTGSSRGMTAASGMTTGDFISGSGLAAAAMPAVTSQAAALSIVADGADYPDNLQVNTVAAAFSDAQFAVLMLGTDDAIAGVSPSTYIANLTTIVNVLEGEHIAVILSTLPPYAADNSLVIQYNAAIQNLAQTRGLPLIDYYTEIMDLGPGTQWQTTLIGSDGIHPTASGAGFSSASNPYTPGGNPATSTTGDAVLNDGYLLRSWLTIQKLTEVEQDVVDAELPALTVATAAAAAANPVTGTSVGLSVLGEENGSGAGLTYTWSSSGPGSVSFSDNDDNTAQNETATLTQAGSYTFTATITDGYDQSVTSSTSVVVNQTLTNIKVAPATASVPDGATQQFTATATDQFGLAIGSPAITWELAGLGTLSATGNYTAPASGTGAATVTALSGSVSAEAAVTVTNSLVLAIQAGGAALGSFVADTDYSGGTAYSNNKVVSTSKVAGNIPAALFGTQRYGNMTYTIPKLTAGASYSVVLLFAETYWTSAGSRLFNVAINGTPVLTNFDVYATAGGANIAIAEQFTATANSGGDIVIQFTNVKDNAEINGIEILNAGPPAIPSPPTGLSAAASTGQVVLSWTASSGATSYDIYRSLSSGGEGSTPYMTGVTSATFTDTGLTNGTTYYYEVSAVNSSGQSATSGETSATSGLVLAINAGGAAVGPFVADIDHSGGSAYSVGNLVNTSKVAGNVPAALFDTQRYGNMTYTIPSLTVGASYSVVLLFAETYWTSAGARLFNIAINGTQVLTNFDVYATAGGENIAIAEQFTATANSGGDIVIQFANVKDNAEINGIEILNAGPPAIPSPPTGLSAAASTGQVALSWTGSSGATSYDIYRALTSGGEGSTPYMTGVTSATFTDTGLTNGTTYYYEVSAVNSSGQSGPSSEVFAKPSATLPSAPTGLSATAGNTQIVLSWTASTTGATSYDVYRATTSGAEGSTPYMTGVTSATFTDMGLTNGTTYYYKVSAVNSSGQSATSGETSATSGLVLAIDAGGGALGPFVADTDHTGGSAYSVGNLVNISKVGGNVPAALFDTQRYGNMTYTIPSLTPGASYSVVLLFAETYWTSAGARLFNVTINGTQVLTNFDVYATVGGANIAIAEQFTATANSGGGVVIQFTNVKDNADINGIEILNA